MKGAPLSSGDRRSGLFFAAIALFAMGERAEPSGGETGRNIEEPEVIEKTLAHLRFRIMRWKLRGSQEPGGGKRSRWLLRWRARAQVERRVEGAVQCA